MSWITKIQLDNYRAFGNKAVIDIPKNQHLLIYGENGSGKSSIYNALKDFFSSSFQNSSIDFKTNKFNTSSTLGSIIVEFDDNESEVYSFDNFTTKTNKSNQNQKIQLSNKIKGFLDYKKMLQVHAINIPDNEQPNVFDLVIKDLLSNHEINNISGGLTNEILINIYDELKSKILRKYPNYLLKNESEINQRLSEIDEAIMSIKSNLSSSKTDLEKLYSLEKEKDLAFNLLEKVEAIELLKKLNIEIKNLLNSVFIKVNYYLKTYFKNKLIVDINFTLLKHNKTKNIISESLKLRIKYADIEIDSYHSFLNEARLSSLAICIYLASISIYSENVTDDIPKILYLDDIFIGLDTSNRFPLLEIIKKEFMDKGFQVFISSYDREWFELSKHWFETQGIKLKGLELFTESDDSINTPDYPVIIPSKRNFEKAKAYLKSKDYTASGNYLRKACEEFISEILPDTYKVNEDASKIRTLENMLNKLETFFDDCEIKKPIELIDAVRVNKSSILNPTSHNDLKSPIFKSELENMLKITEDLEKLSKIKLSRLLIFKKGQIFNYKNTTKNYLAEIELTENLFIVEYNGNRKFTENKFKMKKWTWNNTEFARDASGKTLDQSNIEKSCKQERTLADMFNGIAKSLNINIPVNIYEEITVSSDTEGKTLSSFLE